MSTIRILEEDFTASPFDLRVPASSPDRYKSYNGSPNSNYTQAKRRFNATYPAFGQTEAGTGKFLKKEYDLLLDSQHTYADYGGGAQPMASVLRDYYRYQRTHILGNPHSSNNSSSLSTSHERHARGAALRFLGADPKKYQLIWTANASAALGLIRTHYFQGWEGKVIVVPVNVRTLRVDEDLFRQATQKLDRSERGLVLLTAQSNLCGVKQDYATLLQHAKQNGWDTVLDAAALLPTTPFDLSQHPEIDAIPVSWYKIVGRPDIGCLALPNQFLQKMRKRHFAGGTVAFVSNTTVDSFRLLYSTDAYMDGTIPYGVFPQLRLALDRLEQPRLRKDIAIRVECLLRWLMAELLNFRWPTRHPLVRVVGFPYASKWKHGSALSIVLYDSHGSRIPYSDVFTRLEAYGIDLRSGCMCNTVAAIANPGITARPTPPWLWQYLHQDDKWQLVSTKEGIADPGDEGVIRISVGAPSTFEDVWRILECLRSLISCPLGKQIGKVPRKAGAGSVVNTVKRWYLRSRAPGMLPENGHD